MHRNEIERLIKDVETIRKNVNATLSIMKTIILMSCFAVVLYAPYTFWYWGCLVGLLLMSIEMILSFMLDRE